MSTAPPGLPPRLAPSAGLVAVQSIATGAMRIQRKTTMANQQTSRQAKTAGKVDAGEAKKPARKAESQPRRRSLRARSGSAMAQRSKSAAVEASALPVA